MARMMMRVLCDCGRVYCLHVQRSDLARKLLWFDVRSGVHTLIWNNHVPTEKSTTHNESPRSEIRTKTTPKKKRITFSQDGTRDVEQPLESQHGSRPL